MPCFGLTGLTDGAAVVGLIGGVDAVRGRAVRNAAVDLPVGLAAASLASRQLEQVSSLNVIGFCADESGKTLR